MYFQEEPGGINFWSSVGYSPEGVYPQSEKSLGIVNIDASKGFVDLWVH